MNGDLATLDGRIAIVGCGIGGLVTALELAPRPVVLITRADPGAESSSAWAQGGIAAALGSDDSPDLHLADTLAAGDGLCDAAIATGILREAPEAIAMLERQGVRFDRDAAGNYAPGMEAAHSRRRILHVAGDGSGMAIVQALLSAVHACSSITLLGGTEARRLVTSGGAVTGLVLQRGAENGLLQTRHVVLATGGLGGLFDMTTNPCGNYGQGIAMAARAGAHLADMEFVQFHPTALDTPRRPLPLVSEAVRGEGAILINEKGERFLSGTPGAELAPRDVVARAIGEQIARGGRVFLDASEALGGHFAQHFPIIEGSCREVGIDPSRDPIPVRPAAHYHMGGIWTDERGCSSLSGLWAVGECASTGLHGANRLASNSLLEATVMGMRAARDIGAKIPRETPAAMEPVAVPETKSGAPGLVRPIVSRHLGLLRNDRGLRTAIGELLGFARSDGPGSDPAIVGLAIAVFAMVRRESRGAHARTDHPAPTANPARRRMTLDEVMAIALALPSAELARSA